MKLNSKQVKHESFGTGRIVKSDDSYIEVEFKSGKKKFVFPDVFATHLTLEDEKLGEVVDEIIEVREKEQLEEEQRLIEERESQIRERQIKLEQERLTKNNKSHPSLQVVFWCEEDEIDNIFNEWYVTTGLIKSGKNKGRPNRLARLTRQSSCLITTRESDVAEEDRTIRGLYMVKETFIGKLVDDGQIPAHSEYRLRLSEEESKKMLFWNYYINNRYPDKTTWNSGRYRYFDNIMMAQILRDIIFIKEDSKERELAKNFFDYFCNLNLIDKDNLPSPNGTLLRT